MSYFIFLFSVADYYNFATFNLRIRFMRGRFSVNSVFAFICDGSPLHFLVFGMAFSVLLYNKDYLTFLIKPA